MPNVFCVVNAYRVEWLQMASRTPRYDSTYPLRLTTEMHRRLADTAVREGMSMSAIARRGIEAELDRLDARRERESQG